MKEYLTHYVIEYGLLLGAVIGGIAAMKTSKERILARLVSFFIGVPVAVLISPLLCSLISVTEDNLRTGVAVVAGYGGITLLDKVLTMSYKKIDKNGNA
jgi:hypothetical protein